MKAVCGLILAGLSVGSIAPAGEPPHIGYAFPAGGQQGSAFEATVGGQYLGGATNVLVTGEGVTVDVIDYAIRYDQRELRGLYRRKENLEARIAERKEKGEEFRKEQRQLQQILHRLSLAKLPEGVSPDDKQQALRSYRGETREQFNPQIAERLQLRVSIEEGAAAGERELRVQTLAGLSNPIFFEVGTLPETQEAEPNDDHMAPDLQIIPVPFLVNGQVRPGDIDHFRFKARKGDAVVVHVAARRIIPYLADAVPGWFQAVAALYDEDGSEVAYDDDYKFNPDPVLFYRVPEPGIYTVSIRDAIYRGREDFVYRIAVGELPFITGIFPLGGQQGQNVDITLSGWNLPQARISGTLPEGEGPIRHVSLQKNGYRSNRMPFAIGSLHETAEIEPNDTRELAQELDWPLIANGRIQTPGDRDVYSFHGEKGQTISISIAARKLNSPLDSILSLSGPGLAAPIRNDDSMAKDRSHLHLGAGLVTHHADSYLVHELPATGTYFIEVGDTQSKGGPDYAYRLRLHPAQPDFGLRMEPSGLQIAPGGTAVFTLRVHRLEGFDGPVSIHAADLPDGFKVSRLDIPASADSGRITITAPDSIESEAVRPEVKGTALINGVAVTRSAEPVDDRMQAFLYRHLVPAQELVLNPIPEPQPVTFEVRLPPAGVIELPLGQVVRIPLKGVVHTSRRGINVTVDNPPEGISVVEGWIGRRKDAGPRTPAAFGSLVIKAEPPLKPGDRITLIPAAVATQGREETRYPAPAFSVSVVEGN